MLIALTGASGFIGQNLLKIYSRDHRFKAFVSDPASSSLLRNPNIEYVKLSRDDDPNDAFLHIEGCEAGINLGFARNPVSGTSRFDDFLPSLQTTEAFFLACRDHGIQNVVHISTQAVYAKFGPLPHTEEEPVAPFSFYGAAKAASEAIASTFNTSYGMHVKSLRLAQVIGAAEHRGIIAVYCNALKCGDPLQIWGTGTESSREYIYVDDVCTAIMAALAHPDEDGAFNIGTDESANTLEVATILSTASESASTIVTLPDKQVEHVDFLMSSAKAHERLNWKASYSIEEALHALYREVQA